MKQILFEEWAEEWLMHKQNYVKESTYANYLIAMVNHIIPALSDYYVDEISTQIMQELVLKWTRHGKLNGRGGLSVKTVRDMMIILKTCLKDFGERYDCEIRIRTIEYPAKNTVNRKEILSQEQQEYLMRTIRKNLGYETLGYAVTLHTGIRIGELCALKWKDIDLKNRYIVINKTLQRVYFKSNDNCGSTKIIITPPKSNRAVRDIPISDALYKLIKRLESQDENAYLLTGKGHYIEPRLCRKHYEKFLREHSAEIITFHGLRHTFATRCIEAGADYKVVSELLGHSSVNLTLNLYVHPQMEDKRRCVELI